MEENNININNETPEKKKKLKQKITKAITFGNSFLEDGVAKQNNLKSFFASFSTL